MLFILGLSSYISVLQTSTPLAAVWHFEILHRLPIESIIRGRALVESVYVSECVFKVLESLKGFIKEWKVCRHLCRLAQKSLLSPEPYMPSYGQSQTPLSKTNTAPYSFGNVPATKR